jgi:hypothetical protein
VTRFVGGFDEVQDHVGVTQRMDRGGAHDLLQRDRFEESRRVHEHGPVSPKVRCRDSLARIGRAAGDGELLPTSRLRSVDLPTLGCRRRYKPDFKM